jgi:hypothetical protein
MLVAGSALLGMSPIDQDVQNLHQDTQSIHRSAQQRSRNKLAELLGWLDLQHRFLPDHSSFRLNVLLLKTQNA